MRSKNHARFGWYRSSSMFCWGLIALWSGWAHAGSSAKPRALSTIVCNRAEFALTYVPYEDEILSAYDVVGRCQDYSISFREIFIVPPAEETARFSFVVHCFQEDPSGNYVGSGIPKVITRFDSAVFFSGNNVCVMYGFSGPIPGLVNTLSIDR